MPMHAWPWKYFYLKTPSHDFKMAVNWNLTGSLFLFGSSYANCDQSFNTNPTRHEQLFAQIPLQVVTLYLQGFRQRAPLQPFGV